jgi:hypothetical protein
VELEGTCRAGGGGGSGQYVLPAWVGEMQQHVAGVMSGYLPLLVAAMVASLAVCRVASVHMVGWKSGGGRMANRVDA